MFTSISTARTAARKKQNILPLQPVKRAGRCWLSTCPSMAHGKTALSGFCRGVAVPEIEAVYARMKPVWAHIRLYGVSIGAWLAMQALQGDAPEQTLLVSPVVDMEALITNMMQYAHVTEEQLHRAGEIPTDLGETLSWPYLCWVREHPLHWHGRTQVLYGDRDALTSRTMIERFRQESGAHLTIMEGGEHWFHTPVQMAVLQTWEEANV